MGRRTRISSHVANYESSGEHRFYLWNECASGQQWHWWKNCTHILLIHQDNHFTTQTANCSVSRRFFILREDKTLKIATMDQLGAGFHHQKRQIKQKEICSQEFFLVVSQLCGCCFFLHCFHLSCIWFCCSLYFFIHFDFLFRPKEHEAHKLKYLYFNSTRFNFMNYSGFFLHSSFVAVFFFFP